MAASFDARADSYAEAAVVQRELAGWLAEWLEPADATRTLRAVDLGAGEGLFTRQLVGRFAAVAAVDLAPRMVRLGAAGLPEASWEVADAWQWAPAADAAADRLYSASLLQWCPDPASVLRRWRAAVGPGGRMLHGFYVAPSLVEWQSLQPSPPPFTWRTPREWLARFRAAGWKVLRSEVDERTFRFPAAIDLLRFFHHTGVTIPGQLTAGQTRSILRELDRRHPPCNGHGGVPSDWTFMRVEAEPA
ncbi:MAG: hypothetical protein CMJ58_11730 [Planctomycetaceae bacterium]|nr:hypothetical protein [Planctomycetaceae bacterium]